MIHAIAGATQVQADLAMRGRAVLLTMALVGRLTTVQAAHVIQVLEALVIQVLAEEINVLQFVDRKHSLRIF